MRKGRCGMLGLNRVRRLRAHGRRGQALVEFCLCLPLLLAILLAIIEFARLYGMWYVIDTAAFEGARLAALESSDYDATKVEARVKDVLNTSFGSTESCVVTVDDSATDSQGVKYVKVQVEITPSLIFPRKIGDIRIVPSDSFTIRAVHCARVTTVGL